MKNKSKWLFGPRKTANKPTTEMCSYKLMLNNCYVDNQSAMYRDFDESRDIRSLIRDIAKSMRVYLTDDPDLLDTALFEYLEDELDTTCGVLGLLYSLLWSKAELYEKLKRYEDAEECGEIGSVPRWIPVTERMPEDDYVPGDKTVQIKVIVCNVNNGSRSIRTLTRCWDRWLSIDGNVREWKWRWTWSKNVRDNEITHWMPLFELPKVVE